MEEKIMKVLVLAFCLFSSLLVFSQEEYADNQKFDGSNIFSSFSSDDATDPENKQPENYQVIRNGDGSYTIKNPMFLLGGEFVYFSENNLNTGWRADGVCVYLGFKKSHGGLKKEVSEEVLRVIMQENGIIDYLANSSEKVISMIVCTK